LALDLKYGLKFNKLFKIIISSYELALILSFIVAHNESSKLSLFYFFANILASITDLSYVKKLNYLSSRGLKILRITLI